jgi:glutathione S-transferase
MIRLYHFWQSGNSREVRIVLAEKGLAFESVIVDVMKGETRTPAFLAMNPFGKVPVLADGDLTLYEASIINEYLDERYPDPPLMPKTPAARAIVRARIYWASRHVHAHLGPVLVETLLKPPGERDADLIARGTAALGAAVRALDPMIGEGPYLCGDFSLADAALAPHVTSLDLVGIEPDPALSRFNAWVERLRLRPSFQASGPRSPER